MTTDILESARPYLNDLKDFCSESDVVVHYFPIQRFETRLSLITEMLWDDKDYQLAESYFQRLINGELAPAIVVTGNADNVVDGFHRLYAYRKWKSIGGPSTIPTINLSDLYKIVDDWYDA